jgi:TRAP-type C4-dicarboxylate transport system permease small subunit
VTYLPFPIGFGLLVLFAVEMLWSEWVVFTSLARGRRLPAEKEGRI